MAAQHKKTLKRKNDLRKKLSPRNEVIKKFREAWGYPETGCGNNPADQFIKQDATAARHLGRVADLVDGFETPYCMELLASVHWAAVHDGDVSDGHTAVSGIGRWKDRKRNLFKPAHIHSAWERLRAEW